VQPVCYHRAMRSSKDIQTEYDELKKGKGKPIDSQTDKAYSEAIKRAKLEEQAQEQRDFEARIDQILHSPPQ
jgi:hypothetical protein